MPEPVADAVRLVMKELDNMEKRIKKLESMEGVTGKINDYIQKKKEEIIAEFKEAENRK